MRGANIEPIYNGREDKEGKKTEFKLVLSFAETAVRLVLDVTRVSVRCTTPTIIYIFSIHCLTRQKTLK